MLRDTITQAIVEALKNLGLSDVQVVLERPADLSHGDYSTNIALVAAKKADKNPRQLAEEIFAALGPIAGVQKVEIAGAGFINFHLEDNFFRDSARTILDVGDSWGTNKILKGQRVMYEYTDPNPFKVFHIGHLMSNSLGESLARIAESSGASVIRANYQGDIGPHVAKCMWGLMKEHLDPKSVSDLGKAYVVGNAAYEDDTVAKEEIDSINRRLYDADATLKQLYDAGRATSLQHFEDLYRILGTKFDHYFFESVMSPIGVKIVEEGLTKGIFEKSDGATVYKGEKKGLHTRVFLTSKGTPTYEAKELGLNKSKFENEKLDHSIIITANEQSGYFQVVLAAMAEVLPDVAAKTQHISHGFMQLVGGKMSSRKGNVVSGESLIEEMRAKAFAKMEGRTFESEEEKESVADAVAVAAIKYSILKQGTGKNIVFDPEQSLSFEGDSGPYLQYAYVRARSVLKKAENEVRSTENFPNEVSMLERLLPRFPEVVERAGKEYEPHHVTTYLTELASAFNSWYAEGRILGDEHEAYKLELTKAFALTMKNGLNALGIRVPETM